MNLQTLETAFSAVEEIGQGEITFEMEGLKLSLRIILPHEETEMMRWATGSEEDSAIDFTDKFKIGTLSYALVAIGEHDFRDVQSVETGAKLENGKMVKIPKHTAVRKLLSRWSRPILLNVFRKYNELLTQVENRADKAIQFEPADLDTEIERLEARLTELKAQKEQANVVDHGIISQQVHKLVESPTTEGGPAPEAEVAQEPEAPPVQAKAPMPAPQEPVARRQPVIPQVGSPPVQARPVPAPAVPQIQADASQPYDPLAGVHDSFADPSDMGAIEAENARLLAARRARAAGQTVPSDSMLSAAQAAGVRRRPPHLDAVPVDRALRATQQGQGQEPDEDSNPEVFGGHYAQGQVEEFSTGGRVTGPRAPVELNSPNAGGVVNPRFRSPPGR